MKLVLSSVSLAAALTSQAAMAAGLSFGGGVAVTSNYLSDGLSESGSRPAIQTYFEISRSGFYGGAFASNVRDPSGNRAALDIYGGYRGETAAGLGYDLGYTQHFLNRTGTSSGEISAALDYPLGEKVVLSAEASYDVSEKAFGGNLGAEYILSDAWSATAVVGQSDAAVGPFAGVGVAYKVSDRTSLDLQYQDTRTSRGVAALTLTYAFGEASR